MAFSASHGSDSPPRRYPTRATTRPETGSMAAKTPYGGSKRRNSSKISACSSLLIASVTREPSGSAFSTSPALTSSKRPCCVSPCPNGTASAEAGADLDG